MAAAAPEPVLVLYKSAQCRHCQNLEKMWDSVVNAVKTVYPKLRFYTLTTKDNTGKFDENTAPKDLIRYAAWFPMILLVPGRLWDSAMSNLGPGNPIRLREGVQTMNGAWSGDKMVYQAKYDIRKADNFGKWLKDALANEEFQKAQFLPKQPDQPRTNEIQPLMDKIIRPPIKEVPTKTRYAEIEDISVDVCSMRIRSRPS